MRTMSACCLTVYAKSPGLAMGIERVRRNCEAENRLGEYSRPSSLCESCGISCSPDENGGKTSLIELPTDASQPFPQLSDASQPFPQLSKVPSPTSPLSVFDIRFATVNPGPGLKVKSNSDNLDLRRLY